MNWYKAFLTKTDKDKLIRAIMDVATHQFTEMMRKAGGDPLPATEAVIDNPQDYGARMGLSTENVAEILNSIQNSDGSVTISWKDLPQRNKQQARQRAGAFKSELV
jgi:predicted ThiF/HesA family dinucleotide-utilizing enzyme